MSEENIEPAPGEADNSDIPETKNIQADTPSPAGWGELSDDERKFIENKGWKSPLDALQSYHAMEKSFGSRFSIPKADDVEAWKKLDVQLGRPETIEGYKLEVNDNDKPYIDDFKKAALDAGLRPNQLSHIYDWYKSHGDKMTEAFNQQVDKDKEEIRTLWGNDYSKNEELMKRGFRMTELSGTQLENIEFSIGTKAFMQLGKKLGDFISEDNVRGIGGGKTKTEEMSTEDFIKEIFAKETNEEK